jgi:hypothetical protein
MGEEGRCNERFALNYDAHITRIAFASVLFAFGVLVYFACVGWSPTRSEFLASLCNRAQTSAVGRNGFDLARSTLT